MSLPPIPVPKTRLRGSYGRSGSAPAEWPSRASREAMCDALTRGNSPALASRVADAGWHLPAERELLEQGGWALEATEPASERGRPTGAT